MGQHVPEDKNLHRPLTFGALLDETIHIFRRWWLSFLALSAAALIPSGLLLAAFQVEAPGALLSSGLIRPTSGGIDASVFGAAIGFGLLFGLVNSLFTLAWAVAVTIQTGAIVGGQPLSFGQVYRRALARLLPTIGAGLLVFFAAIPLSIASVALMLVTLGPIGMLADVVLLMLWWLNPTAARRRWTKWLIIACTPFGLVIYFTVRWVLFTPAVVLEAQGPLDSLGRSTSLVEGQWFRVFGVLTVIGTIVAVLVLIPAGLVSLVVTLALNNLLPPRAAAASTNVGNVVGQMLFGAIAYIAYALLFLDLRNRREGADLAARVESLEQQTSVT